MGEPLGASASRLVSEVIYCELLPPIVAKGNAFLDCPEPEGMLNGDEGEEVDMSLVE